MNYNSLISLVLISLGMVACSDDSSSPTGTEAGSTTNFQEFNYDGKERVFAIDTGVTDVKLNGIAGKQVFFSRANIANVNGYIDKSIVPENLSYAKRDNQEIIAALPSLQWASIHEGKSEMPLARSQIASSDVVKPTKVLEQLTQRDFEVGVTKRMFRLPNRRFYGEDLREAEHSDKNYQEEHWIELEFTPCSVGENVIVWLPTSDIDPKTNQPWSYVTYTGLEYLKVEAQATTKITPKMCEALKEKFETILPYETELFGSKSQQIFSVGRTSAMDHPSGPVDIKMYSDLANFTNLVIYNFTAVSGDYLDVLGYHNPDNYSPSYEHFDYPDLKFASAYSNEGNFLYLSEYVFIHPEMFGLDVDEETGVPYSMYSTIAHEYMHSLQYARKTIEQNSLMGDVAFSELLGLLCEYVMAPILEIPTDKDVVARRFIRYRSDYRDVGLFEPSGERVMYESVFALGAFLMHNFGGQELLAEMLRNEFDGTKAILTAVKSVSGEDLKMEDLLKRFLEAMFCNGSEYAENMNKDLEIKAMGDAYTRPGINVFDLTEHGYMSEVALSKLPDSLKFVVNRFPTYSLDSSTEGNTALHAGYGFHVFDVNVMDGEKSVNLQISNNGTRSSRERLYLLVSDKD